MMKKNPSRSELLQQLHDALVLVRFLIVRLGHCNPCPTMIDGLTDVRAGLDQQSHATLVPIASGCVNRVEVGIGLEVHIRARLYELHDDVRVAS